MWQILEHRRVVRRLAKLPLEILKRYEKWKDIVTLSGPPGLAEIRGFNDEPLRGEWKGHRSSRLGGQFRVIYKVESERVTVKVIDLTAHDYRKK
ncbi:MAG: type II toxin-antitoxin system mRNA interferase toxin, RelE/StbE family [Gammaproteobacteria bacterium]|nr:MAG: type II toxin-antitoxin system mRNA interferase toxin, RelE/StbE family [Gammaproteobacteria bacterium]